MAKSFNKFQKPCFWSIFGLFSKFSRQNIFFWKIWLSHPTSYGFYHHAKIQKKLKIQFEENNQTDESAEGMTAPISQEPSGYCWGSNKKEKALRSFINKTFKIEGTLLKFNCFIKHSFGVMHFEQKFKGNFYTHSFANNKFLGHSLSFLLIFTRHRKI